MAQELVYTSLESGLFPGSRGFCTVAMTDGLAQSTRVLLESLSGYAHLFTGHDADYLRNPVAYSHLKDRNGNSIVSRVSACDFDYTGRTNILAHHIVLGSGDRLPSGGPSAVMLAEQVMFREWHEPARYLSQEQLTLRLPVSSSNASCKAVSWMSTSAGAMGAAVLATSFEESQRGSGESPVYICFGLENRALSNEGLLVLINEALALLPESLRWKVTFSTYFTSLPVGMQCDWRCVLENDPGFVRQRAKSIWIDLGTGKIHNAERLDCEEKYQRAQSGLPPASAKVNAFRPHAGVQPERGQIGMKPMGASASSIPARNGKARTFDIEKSRREIEAKLLREDRTNKIALVGIGAAVLLFGAGVSIWYFDKQKTICTPEACMPQSGGKDSAQTSPTQPLTGSPTNSGRLAVSDEGDNAQFQQMPPGGVVSATITNAHNTESESVQQPDIDASNGEKGKVWLISDSNTSKELEGEGWQYVAYSTDRDNKQNERKFYKKDARGRKPEGDVLLFTNVNAPEKYVELKTQDLNWAQMFFSSTTTNALVAKSPEFKVEKNLGLFEALQEHLSIQLTIGWKEQNAQVLQQYKGVVFQAKTKTETLNADELVKGWKESPEEMRKFCESAVDVGPYVEANFKRIIKKFQCPIKNEKNPFDIELDYDDFTFFKKKKDEIKDAESAKKDKFGNKKQGESQSSEKEKLRDIKELRKKVADEAGHGLDAQDAEGFLQFIIEKQEDFDALYVKDESRKVTMTAETMKGVVDAMRITCTLSVDVSLHKPETKNLKTRLEK